MPEGDLVEAKFRLSDGSDVGPLRFSTASTVAMLKYRIVAELPKGATTMVVKRLKDVGAGKEEFEQQMEIVGRIWWQDEIPVCKGNDIQMYYQSLASCISGTTSQRWVPIHSKSDSLNSTELEIHGKCSFWIQPDDFFEDSDFWKLALRNYWSLLSPLIFSDHPKRPGDDDPLPPYNMVRNVMDMNAHYGGLSAALMKEGKSVWVMNVVSLGMRNTLPQKYELFRAKLDAAEQRLTSLGGQSYLVPVAGGGGGRAFRAMHSVEVTLNLKKYKWKSSELKSPGNVAEVQW
ncbi:Membrane-anchored ubiquitin-fold protein 4 [Capsicum annuum]|nr:Membrane-anchored ubiquitin-fold protein 4 [Capsicum annuum]KAF3636805.1 Membrane-anchored ubiquitin-fold protein 4 [Capsicum annuum]